MNPNSKPPGQKLTAKQKKKLRLRKAIEEEQMLLANGGDIDPPEIPLIGPDGKDMTINRKAKRKPMSTRYTRKKEWVEEDAIRALNLENEFSKLQRMPMLILKFPDPELNKEIVKRYSNMIDNVHFQQPSTARYCFVQLKNEADIDVVREELRQITFGTGKLQVEKKNTYSIDRKHDVTPEEIDPYTLYIGNLPTNVSVGAVKLKFPTACRIDIGYAQRMKYTRYAFIRYQSIEDSLAAFRQTYNLVLESRSLIVRFRRQKGTVGLPGETRPRGPGYSGKHPTLSDITGDDTEMDPDYGDIDSKRNLLLTTKDMDSPSCSSTLDDFTMDVFKMESFEDDPSHIQVKDEPQDDYDDYGDDGLEEDEDEDEDFPIGENEEDEDEDEDEFDNLGKDNSDSRYNMYRWDRFRQQELDTKEEKVKLLIIIIFDSYVGKEDGLILC